MSDRDPKFPPGWWIGPGILASALFWAIVFYVLFWGTK
jgi:hypothetical protein